MDRNVYSGVALADVRQARARREVAALDYIRAMRGAAEAGATQVEIARAVGITQKAVSKILHSAKERKLSALPHDHHGASPYEIALRYAAGEISWEIMIQELSAWPYLPANGQQDTPPGNGYPPAMFQQVQQALHDGLIDEEAFRLIRESVAYRQRAVVGVAGS